MIEFEWPWVFAIFPLPLILRWLLPAASTENSAALKLPFEDGLGSVDSTPQYLFLARILFWLSVLIWVLLVVASARPKWVGEPIQQSVSGRDLLMAVDLSGSMQVEDFVVGQQQVDRLTATKQVASDFIRRRTGDRIGLILFGDQAYLQTPLTFDRETVNTLLGEAVIGLAGEKTAIGDAIGLAVKRLRRNNTNQRVLILLTDGANTAGSVSPLQAAELAASEGLKIYTIGIGADEMMVRDFFGTRRVNPSTDLDEKTLTAIAERTGGRYFRARDTNELATIYDILDTMEPVEKENQYYRPRTELFVWPLAVGFFFVLLVAMAKLWPERILGGQKLQRDATVPGNRPEWLPGK